MKVRGRSTTGFSQFQCLLNQSRTPLEQISFMLMSGIEPYPNQHEHQVSGLKGQAS
jgi:hypothetical protein